MNKLAWNPVDTKQLFDFYTLSNFAKVRVTHQPNVNKFAWNPLDSKQLLDVSVKYYRMYFESF